MPLNVINVTCPECNATLDFYADGIRVSLEQLLRLPKAPKKIVRRMNHDLRCSKLMRGDY